MSEQKLDLILNVVSEIKVRQDKLEQRFDGLDQRFDGLSTEFREFRAEITTELRDFKKEVAKSFAAVQNRFALIEKQMVAIGVEIKEEIKAEIKAVNENIDRLEKEILFARSDSVDTRVKVRELENRLTRIENHIGIAI